MLHSTDGDQNLLVRYPSGLVWPMRPAIPCRQGECFGADHEQVEDACDDDHADDAHRDGAAGVRCLLAQRGRCLEAGEGGKAVDHRIREVGEPLVGRRCRREHRHRVVGWANLHQDRDGQRRDDRYLPGHEEQIYGG
jgi:hypothetical protein